MWEESNKLRESYLGSMFLERLEFIKFWMWDYRKKVLFGLLGGFR